MKTSLTSIVVVSCIGFIICKDFSGISVNPDTDEGCGCSLSTWRDPAALQPLQDTVNTNNVDNNIQNDRMAYISGGMGFMGTDKPAIVRDGEGPRRSTELSPFLIDKYEVSNNGKYTLRILIIIFYVCIMRNPDHFLS